MFTPWSSWWDVRIIVAVAITLGFITIAGMFAFAFPTFIWLIALIMGPIAFGMGCLIGSILKENDYS